MACVVRTGVRCYARAFQITHIVEFGGQTPAFMKVLESYLQHTTRNSFNTNGITNEIFLSVFFGRNYRRNISVRHLVGNYRPNYGQKVQN